MVSTCELILLLEISRNLVWSKWKNSVGRFVLTTKTKFSKPLKLLFIYTIYKKTLFFNCSNETIADVYYTISNRYYIGISKKLKSTTSRISFFFVPKYLIVWMKTNNCICKMYFSCCFYIRLSTPKSADNVINGSSMIRQLRVYIIQQLKFTSNAS